MASNNSGTSALCAMVVLTIVGELQTEILWDDRKDAEREKEKYTRQQMRS